MTSQLAALHPPLPDEALLYRDDDIVVLDKPEGLSMQSPERGGDDLISRARLVLARLEPRADYLSVHDHLDRQASGAVLLGRNPAVNAALAKGASRTSWLVCVLARNLPKQGSARVRLVRERDGRMRVARRTDRQVQEVQLSWRVLEAHGERLLAEASVQPGGARHVRAALGSIQGVQVAGDAAVPAPRLMLHASTLELKHPRTSKQVLARAPRPAAFDLWLRPPKAGAAPQPELLDALLREAACRRHPVAARGEVEAFRLFHGEAEGLPGFDLDRFADHLIAWVGEQFEPATREALLDAAERLGPLGVYVKIRPRHASRIVDARRADLAPGAAVRGASADEEFVVREGPLKFLVRPGDGLSTGLFLDQRQNRAWLAARAQGRSVLNLFAYTCSFTIAAAVGGADSSISVDASARVLQTGARNLQLNEVDGERHVTVCDDVLRWLPRARRAGRSFDVIVLDPPSFSTTHASRFSFSSDIVQVAEQCFQLVSPGGGLLLACTNHRSVGVSKLKRWLETAAERAGRRLTRVTQLPNAPDFPTMPDSEPHMKALAVEVGPS